MCLLYQLHHCVLLRKWTASELRSTRRFLQSVGLLRQVGQPTDLFSQVFREIMPPKRGHGHGDEDVGEGSSTVKKIKIVRGKEFVCEYCGDISETAGNLKNDKKKHQPLSVKSATKASLMKLH